MTRRAAADAARILTLAAFAFSCPACSSHGDAGSAASGSAPNASAERVCDASALKASVGRDVAPATGQHPLVIRLRNQGDTCSLRGYPVVRFTDAAGRQIPFAVVDSGDQEVSYRRPTRVRLRAGGSAWIVVNKYRCDSGNLRVVSRIEIRIGNGTGAAALPVGEDAGWAYCGSGDPGSEVHVSPFEPRPSAALSGGRKPVGHDLERTSWPAARRLIRLCKVAAVAQTHAQSVTLTLRDHRQLVTHEPRIDDVIHEVVRADASCPAVTVATE